MSFSPVTPAALANQTAGEQDGHGRVHGTHPFCRGQLRVAGTTHRPYCAIAAGEWLYPRGNADDGHQTRAPLPDIRPLNGRVPAFSPYQ
jgi:hypothetical protein